MYSLSAPGGVTTHAGSFGIDRSQEMIDIVYVLAIIGTFVGIGYIGKAVEKL